MSATAVFRVFVGLALVVAAIILNACGIIHRDWKFALILSGILVLVHFTIDSVIACLNSKLKWPPKEVTKSQFASVRDIVNWLITGSGIIIGFLVKKDITSLCKGAIVSLGLCIIAGIVILDLYGGGITEEDEAKGTLKINKASVVCSLFLLNTMFIFFLIGITGLVASFLF